MVTGGSGFVGSAVIRELVGRGYGVNALVNQKDLQIAEGDVRSIKGGMFDGAAVAEAMIGCDAVMHLVGIIFEKPSAGVTFEKIHFEGTRAIVEGARRAGVKRFAQMSALGARADAVSEYHKTKWRAEEIVRGSGVDWTIMEPSMIHGPRGEFMVMEAKWARRKAAPFFFMPYFGKGALGLGGSGLIQPVYVNDVARAFVDAIGNSKTIGKTYGLGGSEVLTWPQMHRVAAKAIVGKSRLTVAIPAWYAKALAAIAPAGILPFNRDQVVMSEEDSVCDMTLFEDDFGWKPRGFSLSLGEYAGEI